MLLFDVFPPHIKSIKLTINFCWLLHFSIWSMRNNLCLRCHKYSLVRAALPPLKIAYIVLWPTQLALLMSRLLLNFNFNLDLDLVQGFPTPSIRVRVGVQQTIYLTLSLSLARAAGLKSVFVPVPGPAWIGIWVHGSHRNMSVKSPIMTNIKQVNTLKLPILMQICIWATFCNWFLFHFFFSFIFLLWLIIKNWLFAPTKGRCLMSYLILGIYHY